MTQNVVECKKKCEKVLIVAGDCVYLHCEPILISCMKGYTDLEQSERLCEILPIESADMRFAPFGDIHPWFRHVNVIEIGAIPCWSLTALLSIHPMVVGRDLGMFCCWDNQNNLHSKHYNNPVDACYEMILLLHNLNLLKNE